MSIYRTEYGLIFQDDFETLNTERWLVRSPSSAISHVPGQLTLNHTDSGRAVSTMFEIPDEESLVMQVYADYHPVVEGDAGGIVVWKNALEKVEFLETLDSTTEHGYPTWRAVKRYNLWSFFAQQDDLSWELFDSTICIEPTMMGLTVLDGQGEHFRPLKVNRVILCKDTHIKLVNLEHGQFVQLKDAEGQVMNEVEVPLNHGGVAIELPSIPFNGTLHVLKEQQVEIDGELVAERTEISITEEIVEMFGGDVFVKGTDLKVRWRDQLLSEFEPVQIGAIKNGQMDVLMYLVNDNKYDIAHNINIRIAVYEDQFGWLWADIANDIGDTPGDFNDLAIEMGTLMPQDERPFWLRLTRDVEVEGFAEQMMRPSHFYLEVTNE